MGSRKINDAALLNPLTGEQYVTYEPKRNSDGTVLVISGRPEMTERRWTLFDFILASLGENSADGCRLEDVVNWNRVARRLHRAVQQYDRAESREVTLNHDTYNWLVAFCRKTWPLRIRDMGKIVAALEALTGDSLDPEFSTDVET